MKTRPGARSVLRPLDKSVRLPDLAVAEFTSSRALNAFAELYQPAHVRPSDQQHRLPSYVGIEIDHWWMMPGRQSHAPHFVAYALNFHAYLLFSELPAKPSPSIYIFE